MTSTRTANSPQYLGMYGLKVAPFRLSPDPLFFYPAPTHVAAEKILTHGVQNGEGFMVLTGQAGLGKTLLLRRILENFGANKVPVLILSPAVDPVGLLQLLLGELGVDFGNESSQAILLQLFQDQVFQLAEQQQELFIIVDEAQNMPVETLEQLRMLSNLETGRRKLMQILLIGQTELEAVLTDSRLGQLVQRIVIHERLLPLTREQVALYVAFRLQLAGRGDIQLTTAGCRLLHKASRGIPRLINRIMDRTLLLASVERVAVLDKRHVQSAISTMLDIPKNMGGIMRSRWLMAVGGLVLIILLLAGYFLTPLGQRLQTQLSLSRNAPPAAGVVFVAAMPSSILGSGWRS